MNKLATHADTPEAAHDDVDEALGDADAEPGFDAEADDDDEPLDAATGDDDAPAGRTAELPACDAEEELQLILAARQGDAAARDRLVRLHQGTVAWVARRYRGSGVPRDDLVSEGMIGLLTAVDRFDTTRGVRFGTYARWWVLDAMRNCVLRQSRVVRLPANVVKELGRLDRELSVDGAARGEPAPRSVIDRVAQRLQRSGAHVERLLTLREPALSLDGEDAAKVTEDPHAAVASPEAVAIVSELREKMFSLMGGLSAREQLVLTARYGLDTGEPSTLESVAERLGLTAERVRQLQRDALAKLRRSFIDQGLIELETGAGTGAVAGKDANR